MSKGISDQLPRTAAKGSAEAAAGSGRAAHRTDIDGLRALAILLVVVYHVWTSRVSGGVDVFLMISAYFLTASFLRRAEGGERIALGTYWLGRFRRLLPAAAVTLLGVLVMVWLMFPPSRWTGLWRETWTSLFYVQNWQLAGTAVDYYARESVLPSPLQHFWSLSVQGQVFVLWPLLILIGIRVARRLAVPVRAVLIALFGVVFVGSLAYSIVSTAENQAYAYFDTFARLWEFAIGSLLALLAPWLRLPRAVRAAVGWLGIAALVLCGLLLDVGAGFPGYLALWPTLAAAAVMLAGDAPSRWGPGAMLSSWPLQRLAVVAYALYLVHWPILIGYRLATGTGTIGFLEGAGIIAASIVLAIAITYGVERPLQRIGRRSAPRWKSGAIIVASVLAVALPLATWQGGARPTPDTPIEGDPDTRVAAVSPNPGAAVLYGLADPPDDEVELIPAPMELEDQWVVLDGRCVGEARPVDPILADTCVQRTEPSPVRSVLVLGDSHAQQWTGALEPIAAEVNWDLVALVLGGCSFALGEGGNEECLQWREAAIEYAVERKPDLIVLMGTKTVAESSDERILVGLEETIERLEPSGASVLLLRDNPRFDQDMFFCVEVHGRDAPDCSRPRASVLAAENPALALAGGRVGVADLTDYLCPDEVCRSVIGGVVVYLDLNHLTWTYARTLAPPLSAEIDVFTRWPELGG